MKRLLSSMLAFSILLMQPVSLFTAPLTIPPPVATTPALVIPTGERIGVAAALKGLVKMSRQSQIGKTVENGQPIYLEDMITTDERGTLQILLLDETIFTIGPNSSIVIDQFVYDPSTQTGRINAKVVKGVFRFVTGKIARKKPSDMKVELPSGSIGVRGTIVAGETDGTKSTIVLLGPGSRHNTQHRIGQIKIGNGDKEVTVTRPGFGTMIEGPGESPLPPFQIPAEDLARMAAALEVPEAAKASDEENKDSGDGGGSEGGDPTEQAGQDTAAAGDSVEIASEASGITQTLGDTSATVSQRAADLFKIENGLSKLRDLRTVPTGQFHFRVDNAVLSTGTFSLKFDIDFGNRTVGGGNSLFSIAGASSDGSSAVSSRSFSSGDGDASFFYNFNPSHFSGKTTTLTVDFFNSGGQAASSATAAVSTNNGSSTGSASLNKNSGLSSV